MKNIPHTYESTQCASGCFTRSLVRRQEMQLGEHGTFLLLPLSPSLSLTISLYPPPPSPPFRSLDLALRCGWNLSNFSRMISPF